MVNLLGIPVGVGAALWLGALMRYLAARLMGVNVERVAIGVGSRLWRSSSGTVELRAFPITLLIYIAGQDEIDRAPASDDPRSWWCRAAWRRLLVIIAGPVGSYLAAGLIVASSFAMSTLRSW